LWVLSIIFVPVRSVRADREACIAAHEEAQLMRLRGRYTAARENLLLCAQSGCPALISNDCISWLAEVEASLPSVVFAASDGAGRDLVDVRVSANGQLLVERLSGRAVPLDPGVYTMRFEAVGYAAAEQVLTVLEGQKQRLIVAQLTPARSAAQAPAARARDVGFKLRMASYVVGGSALALLGTGIALGVLGKQEHARLERECGAEGCSQGAVDHGKRLYIGADVAFGLAAGLAGAATWLYFRARNGTRRERPSALAQLSAVVHGTGGSVAWRATF
jgi:hypothetical protein